MPARLVRFQEGMKLGHGYDLLSGTSLASPAVQGAISSIQDAGGQTVTKSFLRIDDQKTFVHQHMPHTESESSRAYHRSR